MADTHTRSRGSLRLRQVMQPNSARPSSSSEWLNGYSTGIPAHMTVFFLVLHLVRNHLTNIGEEENHILMSEPVGGEFLHGSTHIL